ncbi:MAG: integrase family protein, partial [Motiliproteus sp.]
MAMNDEKTNRVNFTAGRVNSFTCPAGKNEAYLWDIKATGFGIRAYASGKKSYIFQAAVNGKTKRSVIGPVDAWDIDTARQESNRLRMLADKGVAPSDEKRQRHSEALEIEAEQKRQMITLEQLWSVYVEANRSRWGDKHYNDHSKLIQPPGVPCGRGLTGRSKAGPLWSLRTARIAELTAEKLESWLNKEKESRPGSAAHAYRLLFACLTWCEESVEYTGLINIHNLKSKNLRRSVPKMKARSDVLSREQLPVWFKEMRRIPNQVIAAFTQVLLMTGCRRAELVNLKWTDVDFHWLTLTVRDKATSKGQELGSRTIPMTPYVTHLISALPRRNQWVFSSLYGTSGQLVEPRKSINPALLAAGLEGLTLHGLRRSFATLSEWCEAPAGIVAQIMGHKPSAIAEKHYKHRPIDLLRVWMDRIEVWMLEQGLVDYKVDTDIIHLV